LLTIVIRFLNFFPLHGKTAAGITYPLPIALNRVIDTRWSAHYASVISAVSPSFAKEDSHGAWDLADELKKA